MQFGLKESVIDQLRAVFDRYPQVERAILYGSQAKGNFKPGSDIDLTLVGGEELTLTTLYHIMDEIDDLLLAHSFDLSPYSQINDPDLRDHIRRVGVALYESKPAKDTEIINRRADYLNQETAGAISYQETF